ncbi:TPA_asm: UL20.5 [Human alphaherpesvirus 1]|nr:TPA_asm: UL20.5 [Human alphaherpesvirus 1]
MGEHRQQKLEGNAWNANKARGLVLVRAARGGGRTGHRQPRRALHRQVSNTTTASVVWTLPFEDNPGRVPDTAYWVFRFLPTPFFPLASNELNATSHPRGGYLPHLAWALGRRRKFRVLWSTSKVISRRGTALSKHSPPRMQPGWCLCKNPGVFDLGILLT